MAAVVPDRMKSACPDVHRLAVRAVQLQKFRPIVSYWCEYYILQLILSKSLHTADDDCTQYAAQLMDKLEQYKDANKGNDAIEDDVASKAYIENFALETFNKGDEAQRTNKVTKATADTFQAAATFMELLNIWGPLEPEMQSKIKFAKFHALRIAKACRAGEDPNETNPVLEPPPQPDRTMEDGIEQELKDLENDAGVYKQPTVESAPDSAMPSRPDSTLHQHPLQQPPLPLRTAEENTAPQEPDISPIDSTDNLNSRAGSIGGGYFPATPDAPSNVNSAGPITQPPSSTQTFTTSDPAEFYGSAAQQPSAPPPGDLDRPSRPTPHQATVGPPVPQIHSPAPVIPPPVQAAPAPLQSIQQPTYGGHPTGGYKTDDDSIMAAQKHAKWAISALNFEDVNTAVKELKIALHSLGAS